MEPIRVALLGLGTVGSGVYQTIQTHQQVLQSVLGKRVEVAAILIQDQHKEREIPIHIPITTQFSDILAIPDLDLVIEATVGAEPARSYILQALAKGCHVITANKECISSYGSELFAAAKRFGRNLAIEATVAGGIPIIRTIRQLLQVNRIQKIEAILNGTTNFILTRMRKDQITFAEALTEAQHAGYAEANPKNDVAGIDAYYKIQILSDLIYGEQSKRNSISVKGIDEVDLVDLLLADAMGLRLKLLARMEGNSNQHHVSVAPTLVPESHTLYTVEGVDNGILIYTDVVGKLLLQGPGAGSLPTASAIIEDLVGLYQEPAHTQRIAPLIPGEPAQQESYTHWLAQVMHQTPHSIRDDLNSNYLYSESHVEILHSTTIKANDAYITGLVMRCNEEDLRELAKIFPALYRWYPIVDWQQPASGVHKENRDRFYNPFEIYDKKII